MPRKTAAIIVILTTILAGCGKNETKYTEARKFIKDYTKAMDTYRHDISEAENAKDITSAINAFSKEISELSKEKARIENKYPDLALPGSGPSNVPDELKKEYSDFEKNREETRDATKKMMYTYMSNKRVVNAMMQLSKKLSSFN